MGLTREIGEFAAGLRFADVPEAAVAVVHTAFTDCVGVMLAGPISRSCTARPRMRSTTTTWR